MKYCKDLDKNPRTKFFGKGAVNTENRSEVKIRCDRATKAIASAVAQELGLSWRGGGQFGRLLDLLAAIIAADQLNTRRELCTALESVAHCKIPQEPKEKGGLTLILWVMEFLSDHPQYSYTFASIADNVLAEWNQDATYHPGSPNLLQDEAQ